MANISRHFYSHSSSTFNAPEANGLNVCRMEYGVLRSVYASTACNYSYREFWF